MSDPLRCEQCGGPLTQSGVLRDRCPRCMVELGIDASEEAPTMVGLELGHYRVSASLGSGGMGVVWKARDTRLDRDVAIKTLPTQFDQHQERVARFEREAKLLASLNHPNIAAIHGLGEDHGTRFLVLEFVEGETLAERLRRGAIPLEESLGLARQIGEALEAAHEKGIIHRDLKPANIKVTSGGIVKVLDFGLAKAFASEHPHDDVSGVLSPNIDATEPGLVLGTAAYMSPEQARGRSVDRRTDIWSFGVVLYEMVTGVRPFEGSDQTETMAWLVMKEPDLKRAPARVRHLLRKCLEKDPKDRLRDIGDAWELLSEPSVVADASRKHVLQRGAKLAWIVTSLLAITTAVLFFLQLKPHPPQSSPGYTFSINAPPGGRLPLGIPAVSRDGRIVYTAVGPDGVKRLYLRSRDSGEGRPLSGTEGADYPFWSGDADSLGFMVGPKVKWIDPASETVHELGETMSLWQGSWSPNDDILLRAGHTLVRIAAPGGAPERIPESYSDTSPQFLPDGRRYLVRSDDDDGSSIWLRELGSAVRKRVLEKVNSAPILAPMPDGRFYLFFLIGSDLMAQRFDEADGKVSGKRDVLLPGIARLGNPEIYPAIGVSAIGVLAYQQFKATPTTVKWIDRRSRKINSLPPEASVRGVRLSPSNSRLLGTRSSGSGGVHIWIVDLHRRSNARQLTSGNVKDYYPVWSSDGESVAFQRYGRGIHIIEDIDRGGTSERQLTGVSGVPTSWWGPYLLYNSGDRIHVVDVNSGREQRSAGTRAGHSRDGQISPNGEYIAFVSDQSDHDDVYVVARTPGSNPILVSPNGGTGPRWRGDSAELFFISPESALMAVEIKSGAGPLVGFPQKLFPLEVIRSAARDLYDVDREGQRFFYQSEDVDAPIIVVPDWWVEFEKQLGR